jgi:hypothetical protein
MCLETSRTCLSRWRTHQRTICKCDNFTSKTESVHNDYIYIYAWNSMREGQTPEHADSRLASMLQYALERDKASRAQVLTSMRCTVRGLFACTWAGCIREDCLHVICLVAFARYAALHGMRCAGRCVASWLHLQARGLVAFVRWAALHGLRCAGRCAEQVCGAGAVGAMLYHG